MRTFRLNYFHEFKINKKEAVILPPLANFDLDENIRHIRILIMPD